MQVPGCPLESSSIRTDPSLCAYAVGKVSQLIPSKPAGTSRPDAQSSVLHRRLQQDTSSADANRRRGLALSDKYSYLGSGYQVLAALRDAQRPLVAHQGAS